MKKWKKINSFIACEGNKNRCKNFATWRKENIADLYQRNQKVEGDKYEK